MSLALSVEALNVIRAQQIHEGTYIGEAEIPVETYDKAALYVRNTALKEIRKSPAHYHYCSHAAFSKDTPAFLLGRAIHALILEPGLNKVACAPKLDRRKTDDKAIHAAFLEQNAGKIILSQDDYTKAMHMTEKVLSSRTAQILLQNGQNEHSLFWKDPKTGVKCKARLDFLNREQGFILDLKTSSNPVGLDSFETSIGRYDYEIQAAFYSDGAREILKRDFEFIFLAIESEPPYEFAFYRLNEAAIEKGREQYQANLHKLQQCLATGNWPGYSEEIQEIGIPSWKW